MVNAVSFGKRDNENNPTGGKWIGAGLGLASGWHLNRKGQKVIQGNDEFLSSKEVADALKSENVGKLKSLISESSKIEKNHKKLWLNIIEKSPKKIFEQLNNQAASYELAKQHKTAGMIFLMGILGAIGLGLGAIVDHFRKKDEDD